MSVNDTIEIFTGDLLFKNSGFKIIDKNGFTRIYSLILQTETSKERKKEIIKYIKFQVFSFYYKRFGRLVISQVQRSVTASNVWLNSQPKINVNVLTAITAITHKYA